MSPCLVIISSCHPKHHVVIPTCRFVITTPYHHTVMSLKHHVVISTCRFVINTPCHHIVMSIKHVVISACRFVINPLCHYIIMSPGYHVTRNVAMSLCRHGRIACHYPCHNRVSIPCHYHTPAHAFDMFHVLLTHIRPRC